MSPDPYDQHDPNRIYRLNTDAQLPAERRPRPSRLRLAAVWLLALIVVGFVVTALSDPQPVPAGISTVQSQDDASGPDSPAPKPTAKKLSKARQNAVRAAESYLEFQGFSRKGLIQQLSSKHADAFSKADATYAADHAHADWNAEAVESAKQYLEFQGFSRTGLIKQLSSRYGDQYTRAQAEHAADKVGLK